MSRQAPPFPADVHIELPEITEEGRDLIVQLREAIQASEDATLASYFTGPSASIPLGDPHGFLDDTRLWRYLIARGMNVTKAHEQIHEMLKWRVQRRPDLVRAKEIEYQALTGKGYCPGLDCYGRPVMVLDNTKENITDTDEMMRFLGWNLERACRKMSGRVARYVVVIHLAEFSVFNQPALKVTRETLHIVQNCFAEHVGHIVIYQAGWVFEKFFAAIKYLIDKKTLSKVIMLSGDVSEGSPNDTRMRELLGDEWKELTGADQPKPTPDVSPGYHHEAQWAKVVEEEREWLAQAAKYAA